MGIIKNSMQTGKFIRIGERIGDINIGQGIDKDGSGFTIGNNAIDDFSIATASTDIFFVTGDAIIVTVKSVMLHIAKGIKIFDTYAHTAIGDQVSLNHRR